MKVPLAGIYGKYLALVGGYGYVFIMHIKFSKKGHWWFTPFQEFLVVTPWLSHLVEIIANPK